VFDLGFAEGGTDTAPVLQLAGGDEWQVTSQTFEPFRRELLKRRASLELRTADQASISRIVRPIL
jgi:hypothetical protein